MRDTDCTVFLQWCLPRLGMRWAGYRRVRRQVCKRIGRRLKDLGLAGVPAYRRYVETHPAEWPVLDGFCRVSVSRFYRDKGVFAGLERHVLPALARQAAARGQAGLRCWSAGCASGEEAYTLKILWLQDLQPRFPRLDLRVTATDAGAPMLERARRGCYPKGSLKELPEAWIDAAFSSSDNEYCIRAAYRKGIDWREQDIRRTTPEGPFDLILCRDLVFTYFDAPLQRACLARMTDGLQPNGLLVLGKHETLPEDTAGFTLVDAHHRIYEKIRV